MQEDLSEKIEQEEAMEAQMSDLKESVRIKMSVADDLQNLLKASRQQNQDIREEQKNLNKEKQKLEFDLM